MIVSEVSEMTGKTIQTVSSWIRKYGLKAEKKHCRRKGGGVYYEIKKSDLTAFLKSHSSKPGRQQTTAVYELVDTLSISKSCVQKYHNSGMPYSIPEAYQWIVQETESRGSYPLKGYIKAKEFIG